MLLGVVLSNFCLFPWIFLEALGIVSFLLFLCCERTSFGKVRYDYLIYQGTRVKLSKLSRNSSNFLCYLYLKIGYLTRY